MGLLVLSNFTYFASAFANKLRENAMKKICSTIVIFFMFGSILFIVGRSFRVSKIPNGSKTSCNTCHNNGGGTPRNPFGIAVQSKVTPNGTESFWNPELAALDSDGDGFTNGEELQDPNGLWKEGEPNPGDFSLVTNPGDANSIPTSVLDNLNIFSFQLANNYPNPFNPSTVIRYEIGDTRDVTLKIYNSLGEEIKTLINNKQVAGTYEVQFNASGLSSGIYLYRLEAGNFSETKKMTYIK